MIKKIVAGVLAIITLSAKAQSFNAAMSLAELKAAISEQLKITQYNQETYTLMLAADKKSLSKMDNGSYYSDDAKEYEKFVLNPADDIRALLLNNFVKIKFSSRLAMPYSSFKFSNPASPTSFWSKTDKLIDAKGIDIKVKTVFFRDGTSEDIDEKGRGAYQKNLKTIDSVKVGMSISIPLDYTVLALNKGTGIEENGKNGYIKLLSIQQNMARLEITDGVYEHVMAVYGIDKNGKRVKSRHFQSLREPTDAQLKSMDETVALLTNILVKIDAGNISSQNVVNELNAKLPLVPFPKEKKTVTFYFPRDVVTIEYVYFRSFEDLYRELSIPNTAAPLSPFNIVREEKHNPTLYGIVDALDGSIVVKPGYYNIEHIEGLLYKAQTTKDSPEKEYVLIPSEGKLKELGK